MESDTLRYMKKSFDGLEILSRECLNFLWYMNDCGFQLDEPTTVKFLAIPRSSLVRLKKHYEKDPKSHEALGFLKRRFKKIYEKQSNKVN